MSRDPLCGRAHGHRRDPHGPSPEDAEVLRTDRILGMLARREHGPRGAGARTGDAAIRLLTALVNDVDQRLSSVSITPST